MTRCCLSAALAALGTAVPASAVTHPYSAPVQPIPLCVSHSAAASASAAAAAHHVLPPAAATSHVQASDSWTAAAAEAELPTDAVFPARLSVCLPSQR